MHQTDRLTDKQKGTGCNTIQRTYLYLLWR